MSRFDTIIDRSKTGCVKWGGPESKYGPNHGIIPMGIADMDFKTADEIIEAIKAAADFGIYGYNLGKTNELVPLILDRYNPRGYNITKDSIFFATGVIHSLHLIIQLFTKENDKIILPSPYYGVFKRVIEKNNRQVLESPMVIRNGRYEIDLQDIESKLDDSTTMFLFCDPQNPTGRVFEEYECKAVADFCEKHNLLIVADEIHADMAFARKFVPISSVSEYAYNHTFTLLSCTKTFNMASSGTSFGFINNKEFKEKYDKAADWSGLSSPNIFGLEAMKAAYTKCGYWEEEVKEYLKENTRFACEFINTRIPGVSVMPNEGTYLIWINFRDCGIELNKIGDFLEKEAKVMLNNGSGAGSTSAGYFRMNCALPKAQLTEALERIETALKNRK